MRRGGNEQELRELYLMYEWSFNRVDELGVRWSD